MRAMPICLIVAIACAASGAAPAANQHDQEPGKKQTLIATVFGEPLYLEQVTPENLESKRKELPAAEFKKWLRDSRGKRVYEKVWSAALERYVKREKLSVSDEELAAIAESVERRLKASPESQKDSTFSPAELKGVMVAWLRASLMDWKVCKSLHEKYGGRVGIGSLGNWTAWDGQNALLGEHHKAGEIKFENAELEAAFWQHTKTKKFADAYPTDDRLETLLAKPPYLQD